MAAVNLGTRRLSYPNPSWPHPHLMKHLVVLTGAGVSAESGIRTFRDTNGLWEDHRVEDVASPEGFARDPALVLDFYNQRRAQARTVQPNAAHLALAGFEEQPGWLRERARGRHEHWRKHERP